MKQESMLGVILNILGMMILAIIILIVSGIGAPKRVVNKGLLLDSTQRIINIKDGVIIEIRNHDSTLLGFIYDTTLINTFYLKSNEISLQDSGKRRPH